MAQNPTDPQSYNRYAYVRNNPLKYVDPSGHIAEDLLGPDLVDQAFPEGDDFPDPDQGGDDPAENTVQEGTTDPDSTSEGGGLIGNTTDSNSNNGLGAADTTNLANPSDFYEQDLKDSGVTKESEMEESPVQESAAQDGIDPGTRAALIGAGATVIEAGREIAVAGRDFFNSGPHPLTRGAGLFAIGIGTAMVGFGTLIISEAFGVTNISGINKKEHFDE